jgi:hypothetical protein
MRAYYYIEVEILTVGTATKICGELKKGRICANRRKMHRPKTGDVRTSKKP